MSFDRAQGECIDIGDGVSIKVRLSDAVVMREFVSEIVLMNINTGRYYRVDGDNAQLVRALISYGDTSAAAISLAEHKGGSSNGLHFELLKLSKNLRELGLLQ